MQNSHPTEDFYSKIHYEIEQSVREGNVLWLVQNFELWAPALIDLERTVRSPILTKKRELIYAISSNLVKCNAVALLEALIKRLPQYDIANLPCRPQMSILEFARMERKDALIKILEENGAKMAPYYSAWVFDTRVSFFHSEQELIEKLREREAQSNDNAAKLKIYGDCVGEALRLCHEHKKTPLMQKILDDLALIPSIILSDLMNIFIHDEAYESASLVRDYQSNANARFFAFLKTDEKTAPVLEPPQV